MPNTLLLPTDSPLAVSSAVNILNQDGLIAFPTDTVYGLAARLDSHSAIEKLFTAKGRDFNKAIAVLIGNLEQLNRITDNFPENAKKLAKQFWPGALTIVVDRLPSLPVNLSPNMTVGIRMPKHEFACHLLRASGPLATTSANISGMPNPLSALDVVAQLDGRIDLILDGGLVIGGVPSTVVGFQGTEMKIYRQGLITETEITNKINLD